MNDKRCGFTNNGPCPNEKKCVFPRCDIEYSGSPVWAALRQVVVYKGDQLPVNEPPQKPEEKT
jgi:hypothetical protein